MGAPAAAAHERNHEGDIVCGTSPSPCQAFACEPTPCTLVPANEGKTCVIDPETGTTGTCVAGTCTPTETETP